MHVSLEWCVHPCRLKGLYMLPVSRVFCMFCISFFFPTTSSLLRIGRFSTCMWPNFLPRWSCVSYLTLTHHEHNICRGRTVSGPERQCKVWFPNQISPPSQRCLDSALSNIKAVLAAAQSILAAKGQGELKMLCLIGGKGYHDRVCVLPWVIHLMANKCLTMWVR